MGKITRKERKNIIQTILISMGTFLAVFSIQDWLIERLDAFLITMVGVLIIVFAMWRFNVR